MIQIILNEETAEAARRKPKQTFVKTILSSLVYRQTRDTYFQNKKVYKDFEKKYRKGVTSTTATTAANGAPSIKAAVAMCSPKYLVLGGDDINAFRITNRIF